MPLAIGAAAGWSLHGPATELMAQNGIASLAQEAAYTHGVHGPDQAHPVGFKAADRAQLVDWIRSRLQHSISVPDLSTSGYRFMGGRLVATPHGPAGLLMYDNGHGLHLATLVRPMTTDMGIGYNLVGPTSANPLE